jgi:hypothetical protein
VSDMTLIPGNTASREDLVEWYNIQKELKKIKAREMLLRTKIFGFFFPSPKEGTNNYDMPDGYVLKGKHTINREVDLGAFQAMREQFSQAGIHPDAILQWKPSLRLKEYRELTAEQLDLFDQCLIVKPGSPALEIVLPKKRASALKVPK